MSLQALIENIKTEISSGQETGMNKDILALCEAAEKAKAYIDVCPCDPDITLEQTKSWRDYQDALDICKDVK